MSTQPVISGVERVVIGHPIAWNPIINDDAGFLMGRPIASGIATERGGSPAYKCDPLFGGGTDEINWVESDGGGGGTGPFYQQIDGGGSTEIREYDI